MRKLWFLISFLLLISLGIIGAQDESDKVSIEVLEKLEENNKVNVIVVLKDPGFEYGALNLNYNVNSENVVQELSSFKIEHEFESFNGFSGEINEDDLEILLDDDRVERIEYNYPVKAFLQDSTSLINASIVWNLDYGLGSVTGLNQGICVLDTGIDYTNPYLGGCFGEGCKVINGTDIINSDNDPMDDHGHGTHVAGIVAASGDITGVAPNSTLIAVKVLDSSGNGDSSDIIAGIDWCITNKDLFNISIISMSLGGALSSSACDNDVVAPSVNNAVANGISVIAASGNSGSSTQIASPACITNVTSVGSTDKSDVISSFSDRNSLLDLLAPGENINSTNITDISGIKSGTSMAAPHAAGAVALLRQYYNNTGQSVSVSQIEQQLKETGKSISDSSSGLSFQRIDVYEALNDNRNPGIEISLSNDTAEKDFDTQSVVISFTDAFLDDYESNITYPNGSILADFTTNLILNSSNMDQIGGYTITAWANDTNGNENLTMETFTVQDSSGFSSSSFVFDDFSSGSNFSNQNFNLFNLSIGSEYELSNATFYHNFTEWHANETLVDLGVNETEIIFNGTFPEGVYLIGASGCDINNLCVYSENYTLYIDQSDPSVAITSPESGTSVYTSSITFDYNASDYGISSCDLLINEEINATDNSVSLNAQESFSITLNNGNYTWNVGCTDNVARRANSSSSWNLTVCVPNWECTNYPTTCPSDGTRERTCTDLNSCETDTGKPSESQTCDPDEEDSSSSDSGGSSGGGASGGTTVEDSDSATVNFDANAGDTKTFSISKDVAVSGLELDFKNAVSNAQVSVEKLDEKPSEVGTIDNIYAYIKINTNFVDADLSGAKIKFTIPKNWILINALNNPTNVYMSRYNNGNWQKLETLTAGTDENNQKYEAITPGFSYFAISADKLTLQESTQIAALEEGLESNETEDENAGITEVTGQFSRIRDWFTGKSIKDIVDLEGKKKYYWIGSVVLGISLIYIIFRYKGKIGNFGGLLGETLGKISLSSLKKIPETETKDGLSDKILDHERTIIEEKLKEIKPKELKIEPKKQGKFKEIMQKRLKKEKKKVKSEPIRKKEKTQKRNMEIKDDKFNIVHDKGSKWEDFELEDF